MRIIPYNWKARLKAIDLRVRILMIILIMAVIRVCSDIPLPFVNKDYLSLFKNSIFSQGILGAMTGASFEKLSFFALSISPYITASIIVQLMTIVIPSLEQLTHEGKTGEAVYKRITNICGGAMALLQGCAMAIGFGKQGMITPYNAWTVLFMTVMWTLGACILILVGNFIEEFGLGSGISIILFCNIVSTIPNDIKNYVGMFITGKDILPAICYGAAFAAAFVLIVGACTVLTTTHRDIHVIYSGKMSGQIDSARSVIPVPLLTCSVMPVIFAGSIISVPSIIQAVSGTKNPWIEAAVHYLTPTMWFNRASIRYSLGVLVYLALTYMFTLFYLQISFNSFEIADNLKKSGAVIAGVRPGKSTELVLRKTIRNTALLGNTLLMAMIIAMYVVTGLCNLGSLSMSSTSAIIAVSVINEVFSKIKGEKVSAKSRVSKKKAYTSRLLA